jgi:hypothetical protein
MDNKEHEILLRIGHTCSDYYRQLNPKEITEEEFNIWADSLQEPMRGVMKKDGLDLCRKVLNLQRFILELRDKGMEEYLKSNLTKEDYRYWKAHK